MCHLGLLARSFRVPYWLLDVFGFGSHNWTMFIPGGGGGGVGSLGGGGGGSGGAGSGQREVGKEDRGGRNEGSMQEGEGRTHTESDLFRTQG